MTRRRLLSMARAYLTVSDKNLVVARAQGRCEYCQCWAKYSTDPFHIEHVSPVSRGGADDLDNLALSCSGCNGHKYNKTDAPDPADGKIVPLFDPRRQRWADHFGWQEDYLQIIGLTPTGRATVEALQMNRPGVINLRELFILANIHPPPVN